MLGVRLARPGGLVGGSDGVFLQVHRLGFPLCPFGRLERLGRLPAQAHDALGLGTLGFIGPQPLQVPEEPLHFGPVAQPILKGHFHRRLAAAAPVLDRR
jgi:hypothetical protein